MDKIEIKAIGIENLSGESKTFANINNKKVFLENFKIDDMYIERLSTIMLKFNEISQLLTSKLSILVETFNRIDVNKLLEYSKFILNIDEVKINLINTLLMEKLELISKCTNSNIFVPISYIIDGTNPLDAIDETIFENNNIIEFYIDKMNEWKDIMDEEGSELIDEIIFSTKNKLFKTSCLSLFTLIEKLLLIKGLEARHKNKRITYNDRKEFIKEKVFEKTKAVDDLYNKFIVNNLYQYTGREEMFTRHSCHAENLKNLNNRTMMNLIFMYDFFNLIVA